MGLLSDPHSEKGKLVTVICKLHVPITILLYFGAIVWLCLLPHSKISMNISFSENALLPGLVKTEFSQETIAKEYYEELLDEMKKYKDTIPYPWLTAKFRQIGLDTFVHNFTLNYPLGKRQRFTGNNVYGILRAPRAGSTEAIVLSVPFRPPNNANPTTAPSIAIMLAFAKFAIKEKYWAKDIIFLVTEHEQLGVQAWLQAYHGTGLDEYGVLNYGDLEGRAGQIGAAINLEINDIKISVMDIKIEGLNGQLPNLDIFTLTNKICMKEGLYVTFKNRGSFNPSNNAYKHWKYSLITMFHMIMTQSTGIPNGNHGLFLHYGIQAVTLNGYLRSNSRGNQIGFFSLGKILEGIIRSLNNLLERFHQSYFFYLLPSNDRFVSIIYFIPILGALVGALLVKSLVNWYSIVVKPITTFKSHEISRKELESVDTSQNENVTHDIFKIFSIYITSHGLGLLLIYAGPFFSNLGSQNGYSTDFSIFYGLLLTSFLSLIFPIIFKLSLHKSIVALNMFVLWEIALVILGIGMINISLGIFVGFIFVPLSLLVSVSQNKFRVYFNYFLWILAHPIFVIIFVVSVYTYFMFPNVSFSEFILRSFSAMRQALVFSIVDSHVYGNWIYDVTCLVFLPSWLIMSCVIASCPYAKEMNEGKEKKE